MISIKYSTDSSLASPVQTANVAVDSTTDFTSAIDLSGLAPDTQYWYTPVVDGVDQYTSNYPSFKTFPIHVRSAPLRFAFGSCTKHQDTIGEDTIFAAIPSDARFMLHIGDHAYMDRDTPYGTTLATFRDAHRFVLEGTDITTQNYKDLRARMPVFTTWDDHDIRNDFDAGTGDSMYAAAKQAFKEYQSHSNPDGTDTSLLYYSFQYGDVGFFVLDGRSFRSTETTADTSSKTILGTSQKTALKSWLLDNKYNLRIKFVVTSTLACGYAANTGGDSWGGVDDGTQAPNGANGYRTERNEIWDYIDSNHISGVVFLAGDQHWAGSFKTLYAGRPRYEFLSTPLNMTNNSTYMLPAVARTADPVNGPVLWKLDNTLNVGIVDVDTTVNPPTLAFQLYGVAGSLGANYLTSITLDDIDAGLITPPTNKVSYVGPCTGATNVDGMPIPLSLPAGAVAGDVVVILASDDDQNGVPACAGPTGSTVIVPRTQANSGAGIDYYVFGFAVELTSSDITAGKIFVPFTVYHSPQADGIVCRNESSLFTNGTTSIGVAGTQVVAPFTLKDTGLTTNVDGCLLITAGAVLGTSGVLSPPPSFTSGVQTTLHNQHLIAWMEQGDFGSTGSQKMAYSSNLDVGTSWGIWTIALKPSEPAVVLTATFPNSFHVGDAVNFDVTAALEEGATGTLAINVDQLPAGLTLGTTSMVDSTHYKATVSGTLTTVQDIIANFGATGGSVSSTPFAHEFNVQAAVVGELTIVEVKTVTTGSSITSVSTGIPATFTNNAQAGDQVVVIGTIKGVSGAAFSAHDSSGATYACQTPSGSYISYGGLAFGLGTVLADGPLTVTGYSDHTAEMDMTAYLVRGKTLALDTANVLAIASGSTSPGTTPFTVGPYNTSGPALIMLGGLTTGANFQFQNDDGFTMDSNVHTYYYPTFAHKVAAAALSNDSFNFVNSSSTSVWKAALVVPFTYS